MAAIPLQQDVEYPYSDGQPMAESEIHLNEMLDLIAALRRRYQAEPKVYVAGNMFLYYRKGDPRSVVAPDVFLVRGVSKRKRKSYKLWEEGRIPSLVIEVTSDSTSDEDVDKKKICYEMLGVEEYILHDPEGDYLNPRLQGFRLARGRYEPIPLHRDGSLDSRVTGLTLQVEGKNLRLIDTATGERLPWVDELGDKIREQDDRIRALEAELARLRDASK
ncbi:MAG TPA: Uma2 family endonuclease [Thermoanaerobaculia bacterium]